MLKIYLLTFGSPFSCSVVLALTMSTVEEADHCIKYLDRSVLEGRVITVEKVKSLYFFLILDEWSRFFVFWLLSSISIPTGILDAYKFLWDWKLFSSFHLNFCGRRSAVCSSSSSNSNKQQIKHLNKCQTVRVVCPEFLYFQLLNYVQF